MSTVLPETVSIPHSVTSIGSRAFSGCKSLMDITFEGTMEQWHAVLKDVSWNDCIEVVHRSDGDLQL